MTKLTIRTRITIWYVVSALLLCGVFATILYTSVNRSLYNAIYRMLEVNAFVIGDEVVIDRGFLEFEVDFELDEEVLYSVYALENSSDPILCNHKEFWLDELEGFYTEPHSVTHDGDVWWLLDAPAIDDGVHIADVRVAVESDLVTDATQNLIPVLLILFPIVVLLSLIAGAFIARNAIKPVENITNTAIEIKNGDMTQRIHYQGRTDEIGKLAQAFDDMLDELAAAFLREQRFTSDASHELRTPLAVIIAQAEAVLQADTSPEEAREAMAAVYKKARSMQSMLSQMLMLARAREQQATMEMTRLRVAEIIEDVAEEMRPQALAKDMSIDVDAADDAFLAGDLLLITRMVINLADNAVKYAGNGKHIWLKARREDGRVLIEVADDGPGISEENAAHMFERFYRVDASRTGNIGAGLGLSLVERIAHMHQGTIRLESAPGKGCRFILRFPEA